MGKALRRSGLAAALCFAGNQTFVRIHMEAKVQRFGNYYGITDGAGKWFHYYYATEGHAQAVLETAGYFRDPETMRVNISYAFPAKLIHSGEDPRIIAGLLAEEPKKECKGKAAARALAALMFTEETYLYLERCDPKMLEQAKKALEPFGYPDLDALRTKLGL